MKVDKDKFSIIAKYCQMNYQGQSVQDKPVDIFFLVIDKKTGKSGMCWESLEMTWRDYKKYSNFLDARDSYFASIEEFRRAGVVMKKMEV